MAAILTPVPKRPKRIKLSGHKYNLLKKRVYSRDGYKCRRCQVRSGLTAHHIIFRSQLGDDASYNLITLCNDCHDAVHKHELKILPLKKGEPVDADKGVRWQTSS